MFLLSKDPDLIKPTIRETRNALRIVFKVPSKITLKYEKSPFLIMFLLVLNSGMSCQTIYNVPTVYLNLRKRSINCIVRIKTY